MLPLICVWTNAWVNNRDAGDLRRYRVHYDVTVMGALAMGLTDCLYISVCQVEPVLNSLRPRQSERHFADDIFMCIFFNENCCILIKFSLKYVRKGPIDNNPALVQIMAWRRSMMVSLPTLGLNELNKTTQMYLLLLNVCLCAHTFVFGLIFAEGLRGRTFTPILGESLWRDPSAKCSSKFWCTDIFVVKVWYHKEKTILLFYTQWRLGPYLGLPIGTNTYLWETCLILVIKLKQNYYL